MIRTRTSVWSAALAILCLVALATAQTAGNDADAGDKENRAVATRDEHAPQKHKNAFATLVYGGTKADYEYFLAVRVMIHSLKRTGSLKNADMVVIVSPDVPADQREILIEDGALIIEKDAVSNPYAKQAHFNKRFIFVLAKLWAWTLTQYEKIVMLDADLLFTRNIDNLFYCGGFCAPFINPCHFHTGLFVLAPSKKVFDQMLKRLAQTSSYDGGDQGFLNNYFPELLGAGLFPPDATEPQKPYFQRLPFGFHADHVYYYQRFRWEIEDFCGGVRVIGFPGIPFVKPWYWWSAPLLDLARYWSSQRDITPPDRYMMAIEGQTWWLCIGPFLLLALIWVTMNYTRFGSVVRDRLSGKRPTSFGSGGAAYTLLSSRASANRRMTQRRFDAVCCLIFFLAILIPSKMIPTTARWSMGWFLLFEYCFFLTLLGTYMFVVYCFPQYTPHSLLKITLAYLLPAFALMVLIFFGLANIQFATIITKLVYAIFAPVVCFLFIGSFTFHGMYGKLISVKRALHTTHEENL